MRRLPVTQPDPAARLDSPLGTLLHLMGLVLRGEASSASVHVRRDAPLRTEWRVAVALCQEDGGLRPSEED